MGTARTRSGERILASLGSLNGATVRFEQLNEMEIVFPGTDLIPRHYLLDDPAPVNP